MKAKKFPDFVTSAHKPGGLSSWQEVMMVNSTGKKREKKKLRVSENGHKKRPEFGRIEKKNKVSLITHLALEKSGLIQGPLFLSHGRFYERSPL